MEKVLFKFGTSAQYLALENKLDNALYFLTDTGELYKGDQAIAKSRVYKGTRQLNENNDEALLRISADYIPVAGDIGIIINSDNTLDAFIRSSDNLWNQINTPTSQLENRLNNLELLVNNLGTVFSYRGSVADLSNISNPRNGDVYIVENSEYVWNGSKWIEFGSPIDLSNYATKDLIGNPQSSYIDSETGETIITPATGIYKELFDHAETILPLFNGVKSGLVPIAEATLTEKEKAHKVLNALGQWITVNDMQEYTTPDGKKFNNIEEYIEYMVSNYSELLWESIDE